MGYDLRNMTGKQALVLAKSLSGLNNEEISERSGISLSEIVRYFGEHQHYHPGLYRVPALCRALGNQILMDWLSSQLEDLDETKGVSVKKLMQGVAALGSEAGHVFAEMVKAVEDGAVDHEEARTLCGELVDVEKTAHKMRERLEPLAGQKFEGGKWVAAGARQ